MKKQQFQHLENPHDSFRGFLEENDFTNNEITHECCLCEKNSLSILPENEDEEKALLVTL